MTVNGSVCDTEVSVMRTDFGRSATPSSAFLDLSSRAKRGTRFAHTTTGLRRSTGFPQSSAMPSSMICHHEPALAGEGSAFAATTTSSGVLWHSATPRPGRPMICHHERSEGSAFRRWSHSVLVNSKPLPRSPCLSSEPNSFPKWNDTPKKSTNSLDTRFFFRSPLTLERPSRPPR